MPLPSIEEAQPRSPNVEISGGPASANSQNKQSLTEVDIPHAHAAKSIVLSLRHAWLAFYSAISSWLLESGAVILGYDLGGRALPALHVQVRQMIINQTGVSAGREGSWFDHMAGACCSLTSYAILGALMVRFLIIQSILGKIML